MQLVVENLEKIIEISKMQKYMTKQLVFNKLTGIFQSYERFSQYEIMVNYHHSYFIGLDHDYIYIESSHKEHIHFKKGNLSIFSGNTVEKFSYSDPLELIRLRIAMIQEEDFGTY